VVGNESRRSFIGRCWNEALLSAITRSHSIEKYPVEENPQRIFLILAGLSSDDEDLGVSRMTPSDLVYGDVTQLIISL
jgi:hypothetical protein